MSARSRRPRRPTRRSSSAPRAARSRTRKQLTTFGVEQARDVARSDAAARSRPDAHRLRRRPRRPRADARPERRVGHLLRRPSRPARPSRSTSSAGATTIATGSVSPTTSTPRFDRLWVADDLGWADVRIDVTADSCQAPYRHQTRPDIGRLRRDRTRRDRRRCTRSARRRARPRLAREFALVAAPDRSARRRGLPGPRPRPARLRSVVAHPGSSRPIAATTCPPTCAPCSTTSAPTPRRSSATTGDRLVVWDLARFHPDRVAGVDQRQRAVHPVADAADRAVPLGRTGIGSSTCCTSSSPTLPRTSSKPTSN